MKIMTILFVFLVLVFLKVYFLERVHHLLPAEELKRRARSGDARASKLNKLLPYHKELDFLLWFFGVASTAGLFIMSARYAWWAAVVLAVVISWLWFRAPWPVVDGWLWKFCAATAPYVAKILDFIKPVVGSLANVVISNHTWRSGIYEKTDALEMLEAQARQPDNRIDEQELQRAVAALEFSDKVAKLVMLPRKKIRFVSHDESLGPQLLDELHGQGQARFLVVDGSTKPDMPKLSGSIYLKDLIDHLQATSLASFINKKVVYINEDSSLFQCLDAVLKTGSPMLGVVDDSQKLVGALDAETLLSAALGPLPPSDFDQYENLHVVAGWQNEKT